MLPSVVGMVIDFPDFEGPKSFDRSTFIVRICLSRFISMFFILSGCDSSMHDLFCQKGDEIEKYPPEGKDLGYPGPEAQMSMVSPWSQGFSHTSTRREMSVRLTR